LPIARAPSAPFRDPCRPRIVPLPVLALRRQHQPDARFSRQRLPQRPMRRLKPSWAPRRFPFPYRSQLGGNAERHRPLEHLEPAAGPFSRLAWATTAAYPALTAAAHPWAGPTFQAHIGRQSLLGLTTAQPLLDCGAGMRPPLAGTPRRVTRPVVAFAHHGFERPPLMGLIHPARVTRLTLPGPSGHPFVFRLPYAARKFLYM
jgi:hypothetical protein